MTDRETKQSLLWTESGQEREGPVAEVAVVGPLERNYSYAIPEKMVSEIQPGQRVMVPVGRKDRPVLGFCVRVDLGSWSSTLKPILEVVDPMPLLGERLLELGRWISSYYLCPLGRVLAAMVPEAAKSRSGFRKVKFVRLVRPAEEIAEGTFTAKQRAAVEALVSAGGPVSASELSARCGASGAVLSKLAERGWIEIEHRLVPAPAPDFDLPGESPGFELTTAQREALSRVEEWLEPPVFRVGLLYGVSGSGKTEVYVRAIQRCVEAGRQAIVLVPEIALTSQAAPRLATRFRDVAVLHSGLRGTNKSLTWHAIARGEKRVVIGTRSAVFAPCPNLGLIVVDEEQEGSFKNQQAPRYHARDVAIKRGQMEGVPVLMGTATPSLESWINAQRLEHFCLLRLPERVSGLPLPEVHLVDMRAQEGERGGGRLLSPPMEAGLRETLERGEQAVLLLNRRGFATLMFCPVCKKRISCPRCGTNMVYHQSGHRAVCHYCGAAVSVPEVCPDVTCRGRLVRIGMGTQRIEEELAHRLPHARVQRVDSDTMRAAEDYRRVIARFEARQIDVLLGTQMIAKGLDFPFVSFVGVITADTALALPDFRAAERTFQLVTQVAGRAGRSRETGHEGGRVVVQTYSPELPAIQAAVHQSYEEFASQELRTRHQLSLPPYSRLIRIVLEDPRDSRLAEESDALAGQIREALAALELGLRVGGPARCPLRRIRGMYRRQILISAAGSAGRAEAVSALRGENLLTARVKRLIVDADPISLM